MTEARPEGTADPPRPALPDDGRAAFVQRPRLLSRLQDSSAPLVLINAPSGYGKSVLIEQWAEIDPRPFAALILGTEHDDPAMLVGSIVTALDPIEPVGKEVGAALTGPQPDFEGVVLPRLEATLEDRQVPFVLVLDDFERIGAPEALAVVSVLIGALGDRQAPSPPSDRRDRGSGPGHEGSGMPRTPGGDRPRPERPTAGDRRRADGGLAGGALSRRSGPSAVAASERGDHPVRR
jgi:hypothetical protein